MSDSEPTGPSKKSQMNEPTVVWRWYYSYSEWGEAKTKDAALWALGTEVMRYTCIDFEDCIAEVFGDTTYYYPPTEVDLPAEVDSPLRNTWRITRVEKGEEGTNGD